MAIFQTHTSSMAQNAICNQWKVTLWQLNERPKQRSLGVTNFNSYQYVDNQGPVARGMVSANPG